MRRVRVPKEALGAGRIRLRGGEARHLRDVLRLRAGAHVEIFDGEGASWLAEVLATSASGVELSPIRPIVRRTESMLSLTLAVALAKGAKLDWVIEKTTELGVSRIVPFVSERTVPERGRDARLRRWQRIAAAAAAQSGRTVCPAIDEVRTFAEVLALRAPYERALFFWEEEGSSLPCDRDPAVRSAMLVTGAEGGFSAVEASAARQAGFTVAGLGPRILRAETAAVVAVVLAQLSWGDLAAGG